MASETFVVTTDRRTDIPSSDRCEFYGSARTRRRNSRIEDWKDCTSSAATSLSPIQRRPGAADEFELTRRDLERTTRQIGVAQE
jgi:hypothetical protein